MERLKLALSSYPFAEFSVLNSPVRLCIKAFDLTHTFSLSLLSLSGHQFLSGPVWSLFGACPAFFLIRWASSAEHGKVEGNELYLSPGSHFLVTSWSSVPI